MPDRIHHKTAFMISDVHVGDPDTPALEDFDRDADFERFLKEIIPDRANGNASLIIAGDFIDFPQILPELGKNSPGRHYGTTEEESVSRIKKAIKGHPTVFAALRHFLDHGNQVLMLPGNHDIDLHFPGVMEELRSAIGAASDSPKFSFVSEGCIREKRIYIEHGNQYAYDNRFEHWGNPILNAPDGKQRLERAWGTLFLDEVFNGIEGVYPFANRTFPHAALGASILASDTLTALPKVALLIAFFVTKGKRYVGAQLLGGDLQDDDQPPTRQSIEYLVDRIAHLSHAEKRALVDTVVDQTGAMEAQENDADEDGEQLAPNLLGRNDESGLEKRALELLRSGTIDIVAFGHTHNPFAKPRNLGGRKVHTFNTGGWIPAVELQWTKLPTVDKLRDIKPQHDLRYLVLDLQPSPVATLESLQATLVP